MYYSNLRKYDIANGEGVRTSLFVSGCQFHCEDCFNSETWDYNAGKPYTEDTHRLIDEYLSDSNISGLSLLGGDPLWQSPSGMISLIDLCKDAHNHNKNVWIWSGFTWEQIFPVVDTDDINILKATRQELIKNCDVWIDGRFEKDKKNLTLKWRGSSNQRVINVKESLKQNKVVLYEK